MYFISWDIETDTSGGYGLDPSNGGIASIAAGFYRFAEQDQASGKPALRDPFYGYVGDGGVREDELLLDFDRWLSSLPTCHLIGWNTVCFDAPFCAKRAELAQVDVDLWMSYTSAYRHRNPNCLGVYGGYDHRWGRHTGLDLSFDGYEKSWREEHKVGGSLDDVAGHFGMTPIKVDRTKIHELSAEELRAYNMSDVATVAELFVGL